MYKVGISSYTEGILVLDYLTDNAKSSWRDVRSVYLFKDVLVIKYKPSQSLLYNTTVLHHDDKIKQLVMCQQRNLAPLIP